MQMDMGDMNINIENMQMSDMNMNLQMSGMNMNMDNF